MLDPVYVCGPHGAGKTTLVRNVTADGVIAQLSRLPFPVQDVGPFERAFVRAAVYFTELLIHRAVCGGDPQTPRIGDRCVLDTLSYIRAYSKLRWISNSHACELEQSIKSLFQETAWPKTAIVLLVPPAELDVRLKKRANEGAESLRWRHEDRDFLFCLCESYREVMREFEELDRTRILWLSNAHPKVMAERARSFILDCHLEHVRTEGKSATDLSGA